MSVITPEIPRALAPSTAKAKRDRFLPYFNECLPRYGITSELRVGAFLATVCFESDYFKATEEYASGRAYDIEVNPKKAIGLGNTTPGDGVRYKGRTGIQTTGKKNYARLTEIIGKRDGVDFVKNPERLSDPKYFVEGACVYWKDHNLNALADKGKFHDIQGIVNRGDARKTAKDFTDRLDLYEKALRVLPDDFNIEQPQTVTTPNNPPLPSVPSVVPDQSAGFPPTATAQPNSDGVTESVTTGQGAAPNTSEPEKSSSEASFTQKITNAYKTTVGYAQKAIEVRSNLGVIKDAVSITKTPISASSRFIGYGMKIFGWLLLVYEIAKDNWFYVLVALGLIALAVFYIVSAKNRTASKTVAAINNGV